jgi:hypothetical protein
MLRHDFVFLRNTTSEMLWLHPMTSVPCWRPLKIQPHATVLQQACFPHSEHPHIKTSGKYVVVKQLRNAHTHTHWPNSYTDTDTHIHTWNTVLFQILQSISLQHPCLKYKMCIALLDHDFRTPLAFIVLELNGHGIKLFRNHQCLPPSDRQSKSIFRTDTKHKKRVHNL